MNCLFGLSWCGQAYQPQDLVDHYPSPHHLDTDEDRDKMASKEFWAEHPNGSFVIREMIPGPPHTTDTHVYGAGMREFCCRRCADKQLGRDQK